MPPRINREIQIGELVMNYPQAVGVLFAHGFHCIGCGLSAYETLEQGAAAHGFDDATIDEIIGEITEAVKKAESGPPVRKCEEAGAAQEGKPEKENQVGRKEAGAAPKGKPGKKK